MIKRKPRKQKAAKDEVGRAIVEQSKHELFLKINEKRFFLVENTAVFCCNWSSLDSKSVCSLTSQHETVASLCREEKTRTKIKCYCSVSSSFTLKISLKFVKCASVFVFHWPGVLLLIHNAQ